MQNAIEISRITLVVSHDDKLDILTDILNDLNRSSGLDRSVIHFDSQPMCRLNIEGEVELG